MLPDTEVDGAVSVAERIRAELAERSVVVGENSATLTLSTGVAEFPTDGDSPESLIASADAALYKAKRRGRDRVVCVSRRRGTSASKPPKSAMRRKTDA